MAQVTKTCIVCPKGCRLIIETGDTIEVTGNGCKKGVEFAAEEMTNPKRTLQTTVKTTFDYCERLPVRTTAAILKGMMEGAVKEAKKVTVTKKLKMGDTVLDDILGTGVSFVASQSVDLSMYNGK